jgi:hypothetical protein
MSEADAPAPPSRRPASFIETRAGAIHATRPKLVGTGPVGIAEQGISVALSADGNTAIAGGPSDNSRTGAASETSEAWLNGELGLHRQRRWWTQQTRRPIP